jgi:hypothetical protein
MDTPCLKIADPGLSPAE